MISEVQQFGGGGRAGYLMLEFQSTPVWRNAVRSAFLYAERGRSGIPSLGTH